MSNYGKLVTFNDVNRKRKSLFCVASCPTVLWLVLPSTTPKQCLCQAEEQACTISQDTVVEEDSQKDWKLMDATVPVLFHLKVQSNT